MARASSLLFLSLLLMAASAAASRAHNTIQGLSATGSLCCTSTGNCPGPTVTGAATRLICPTRLGGTAVVGLNTTDADGFFNVTGRVTPGVIIGSSSNMVCGVYVQLPLSSAVCFELSTAVGSLYGTLRSTGTVVTEALGLVQTERVAFFLRL